MPLGCRCTLPGERSLSSAARLAGCRGRIGRREPLDTLEDNGPSLRSYNSWTGWMPPAPFARLSSAWSVPAAAPPTGELILLLRTEARGAAPMNVASAGDWRASESTAEPRWADVVERISQDDPPEWKTSTGFFPKAVRFFFTGNWDLETSTMRSMMCSSRGTGHSSRRLARSGAPNGLCAYSSEAPVAWHIEDAVQFNNGATTSISTVPSCSLTTTPIRSAMPSKMRTNWWPGSQQHRQTRP